MSPTKLTIVAVFLGSVGFFLWHVAAPRESHVTKTDSPDWIPPAMHPTPIGMTKSSECRSCHAEVWDEWYGSQHRQAYTNPLVQQAATGFQGKGVDCLPCHLPSPVAESGFGERPLERYTRRDDGVDCFTCHHWPEGHRMLAAGPLGAGADSAPCQPAVTPSVRSLSLCAMCHNQHKVHFDWEETRFAVPGPGFQDCNGCHMPAVERTLPDGTRRPGRSHRYPAAKDPEFLRSSLTVETQPLEDGVFIRVTNSGAGHNLPADERHRALDVHVQFSLDGERRDVRVGRFRNPYRDEFEAKNPLPEPGMVFEEERPIPGSAAVVRVRLRRVAASHRPNRTVFYPANTQIPAGESREFEVFLPPSAQGPTVKIWYRPFPQAGDDLSTLLYP